MMRLRLLTGGIIVLVLSFSCGMTVESHGSLPVFSLRSKVVQCKGVNSPENFYIKVALPSITSMLEEGKIFFGVLMDRLESSLADAEKYETLEKEWSYLMNVITQSFDLAIARIQSSWDLVIDHHDTPLLPWELRLSPFVLQNLLNNLENDYRIISAVVRQGTKELMSTLKIYLGEIMEKLEDSIFNANVEEPKTEREVLRRMEKGVKKLEPNFIGHLLKRILQRMRGHNGQPSTITFLKEPLDEIALTLEAFRNRGHEFPNFWSDMAHILRVNGSSSPEELFHRYVTDEELIINSVVALLSTDLS